MASQQTTQAAQNLQSRVTDLQKTATQYITKEQNRISNEVQVLKAVLSGRTGGQGVQTSSAAAVSAIAYNDLNNFLLGTSP